MDRKTAIEGIRDELNNIEMEQGSIEDSLDAIRRSQEEIELSMTTLIYNLEDLEAMENGEEE